MIEVRKIKLKEDLEAAFAVRHRVFVVEQEVDPAEEYDEDDEKCTHFLATANGIVCGTARWRFKSKGVIKLERFAVDKEYRSLGIGAALVRAIVKDLPYNKQVIMHAQLHAIPFYEQLGFKCFGPQFEEAGIQHFAMEMK
ncbi:MAG: GNAT family N-acetyltransferase [Bacteroidia bacterium]